MLLCINYYETFFYFIGFGVTHTGGPFFIVIPVLVTGTLAVKDIPALEFLHTSPIATFLLPLMSAGVPLLVKSVHSPKSNPSWNPYLLKGMPIPIDTCQTILWVK
jgi:hypothetical protein